MRVKRVRSPNSARRTATVVGPNSGTRAHTGGLGILVQQLVDLALQLRQVLLGMVQLIAENAQAARSGSDGHPTADRRFGQPHQFLRSWPPRLGAVPVHARTRLRVSTSVCAMACALGERLRTARAVGRVGSTKTCVNSGPSPTYQLVYE